MLDYSFKFDLQSVCSSAFLSYLLVVFTTCPHTVSPCLIFNTQCLLCAYLCNPLVDAVPNTESLKPHFISYNLQKAKRLYEFKT